ncbi:MAG: hypothetical protein COB04_07120 [Gammaproteobacteria bacterium]|nr:MAG: hypothetical protein COB04_07120 [Gammaproteobacteria bacterium]
MNHSNIVKKTIGLALIATLAACASTPDKKAAMVADCTFPDAPEIAAPNWICDETVEGGTKW